MPVSPAECEIFSLPQPPWRRRISYQSVQRMRGDLCTCLVVPTTVCSTISLSKRCCLTWQSCVEEVEFVFSRTGVPDRSS